jgi:hypothetical protein
MEPQNQRDLDSVLALYADDVVWPGFTPQPLDVVNNKIAETWRNLDILGMLH